MKAGCEVVVAGYDAPPNGRYWGNNGQKWILARDGLSAFDPYATSGKPLFDRLGGNSEHARWNGEAERFCGHGAVRPIASRNPRRLLSSKSLQRSSGECRLNSAVLRASRPRRRFRSPNRRTIWTALLF